MQQHPSYEATHTPMRSSVPTRRRLVHAVASYERRLSSHPIETFGAWWDGTAIRSQPVPLSDGDARLGYQPPPLLPIEVPKSAWRSNGMRFCLYAASFNKYVTLVAARVEKRSNDLDLFTDWLIRGTPGKCAICIADTHGGRYYFPVDARGLEEVDAQGAADVLIAFEPFIQPTDYAALQIADWTGRNFDQIRLGIEDERLEALIQSEVQRPWLAESVRSRVAAVARMEEGSPGDSLLGKVRDWLAG